ncbi:hypothetical protein GQ44DRAFT_741717 [Phaeosphaeriaceae sp. PMI808]|nr:hypothetical protein GQ44DRAFT_741717 [Phaeosphaeriaceae sp. PMI808]
MEGLSVAANSLAVVSVAFQLTEACIKLYRFWESVEDAPQEIAAIKEDMKYLISIFKRIESNNHPLGECITEGIQHCRLKVLNAKMDSSQGGHSEQVPSKVSRVPGLPSPPIYGEAFGQPMPVLANNGAQQVLKKYEKSVPGNDMTDAKLEELMLQAIGRIAISNFESDSLEILAQDGYTMDDSGIVRSKTFVYSENLRYRVRHQASSFQTALGCVWIRTTIIDLPDEAEAEDKNEESQSVTSFVFYPTRWVQHLGIRSGLEAIMASASRSWVFNCRLTVTRAVPEDSLIFELCRTGQTRAVEILLKKGLGSVVDTSPKGWKPLHFAAAGGHVDLCSTLIKAGADKSALVYEGPNASILESHVDVKIPMLRLFSECIDLADANSDGWTVHEWLKRSYAREKVPISRNSITWLLLMTCNEEYVNFSSRTIWLGLQHAIRTVLCHERHGQFLVRILDLSDSEAEAIGPSHLDSISLLMAFRVTGRVILQMAVTGGSFLHIKGFDWVDDDDVSRSQYLQTLPMIYSAWCHALLDCADNMEDYLREEFEQHLEQLRLTREGFLDTMSCRITNSGNGHKNRTENMCTSCANDYNSLPSGLVSPVRISLAECAQTHHRFNCGCDRVYKSGFVALNIPLSEYSCFSGNYAEDSDDDEEFYDAEPYPTADSILPEEDSADAFSKVATPLYRCHGRYWLGEYEADEYLCATCFLVRERYTGEDGLIADFPPMPEHFEGLRFKW